MGRKVVFRDGGGVIYYKDGRQIPFIERLGVFFVALNVLPPELVSSKLQKYVNHVNATKPAKDGPADFIRQGSGR